MTPINQAFTFGISPHLLFPGCEQDPLTHLAAVSRVCALRCYDSLEMFLPADAHARKTEIALLRDAGKQLNYNFPVDFQLDGAFNAGSADPKIRRSAVDLALRNVDYAAEADSPILVITSCVDQGAENRPAVLERFEAFFHTVADYAQERGMAVAVEALERGVFKDMLLGPTSETCAFIKKMRAEGCKNAYTIVDTAHLPLMGEAFSPALALSVEAGIGHMHIGNSVMKPESPYYGHKHPPLGIQDGVYDVSDVQAFFLELLEYGYLSISPRENRPLISLEMLTYPGVSPELSAQMAYEKISFAFEKAAAQYRQKV